MWYNKPLKLSLFNNSVYITQPKSVGGKGDFGHFKSSQQRVFAGKV